MVDAADRFVSKYSKYIEDLGDKRASFKGMIYGESGVGKTVAAMQLAKAISAITLDRSILYIDSAQGWVSLKNHPDLIKDTLRLALPGIDDLPEVAKLIKQGMAPFADIGTVVIDEHSSYANSDLLMLTQNRAKDDKNKDPDTPAWPDMNASSNRVLKATTAFLALDNVSVILCAHQREDKDGTRVKISPQYLPKFGSKIRELLHMVAYMTADTRPSGTGKPVYQRKVQIHPTANIVAKTRVGGLNATHVTVPDFIKGIQHWLGGTDYTPTEKVLNQVQYEGVEPSDNPTSLDNELEEVGN